MKIDAIEEYLNGNYMKFQDHGGSKKPKLYVTGTAYTTDDTGKEYVKNLVYNPDEAVNNSTPITINLDGQWTRSAPYIGSNMRSVEFKDKNGRRIGVTNVNGKPHLEFYNDGRKTYYDNNLSEYNLPNMQARGFDLKFKSGGPIKYFQNGKKIESASIGTTINKVRSKAAGIAGRVAGTAIRKTREILKKTPITPYKITKKVRETVKKITEPSTKSSKNANKYNGRKLNEGVRIHIPGVYSDYYQNYSDARNFYNLNKSNSSEVDSQQTQQNDQETNYTPVLNQRWDRDDQNKVSYGDSYTLTEQDYEAARERLRQRDLEKQREAEEERRKFGFSADPNIRVLTQREIMQRAKQRQIDEWARQEAKRFGF